MNFDHGDDSVLYAPNYHYNFFAVDEKNPSSTGSPYLQVSQVTKDYLNPFGNEFSKILYFSVKGIQTIFF